MEIYSSKPPAYVRVFELLIIVFVGGLTAWLSTIRVSEVLAVEKTEPEPTTTELSQPTLNTELAPVADGVVPPRPPENDPAALEPAEPEKDPAQPPRPAPKAKPKSPPPPAKKPVVAAPQPPPPPEPQPRYQPRDFNKRSFNSRGFNPR